MSLPRGIDTLALRWSEASDPHLWILDQQLLPQQELWLPISNTQEMVRAIRALQVRGAPLIGIAAVLCLAQSAKRGTSKQNLLIEAEQLKASRPTAVNLMNCVNRLIRVIEGIQSSDSLGQGVSKEAMAVANEDAELCERMSNFGASLVANGDQILTHCNAGGLATAGIGTAIGVIRRAHEQGKRIHVFVDETRPLLQGGRLTTWELEKLQIPYTLITDNMAGHLMSLGKINKIFVGCDRIAANGDFANKIGTYSVAVLAHFHRIPFYVVGPRTTIDCDCPSGAEIPIEQRDGDEVRGAQGAFGKVTWSPAKASTYNPSFDVTPAGLVTRWVLDTGVYDQKHVVEGEFQ